MIASILDNDSVHFEHRGAGYVITRLGPTDWSVRADDGTAVGALTVMSPEGEEHEPVYGGIVRGQSETDYEGSDWESIVRALVNELLDADEPVS
ncbi:hypothetical protein [Humibacter ginsenosidimutans]|uniref:Uncharacterized protein n=1 Tax=Humibacter ginsenosidimutans TaxID=2599293 RepID=A0A5B8LZV1_9MICO|nr:hypothetical protein [Humibacter ginsenosidimutans]QDZ13653.1 hypothetical protein FPZ11_01540 [Humibacter ginsenosidimutans]